MEVFIKNSVKVTRTGDHFEVDGRQLQSPLAATSKRVSEQPEQIVVVYALRPEVVVALAAEIDEAANEGGR